MAKEFPLKGPFGSLVDEVKGNPKVRLHCDLSGKADVDDGLEVLDASEPALTSKDESDPYKNAPKTRMGYSV